jgi:hypothetical protein
MILTAIGLAVLALVVTLVLAIHVNRLNHKLVAVTIDGDIFDALRRVDADLAKLEEVVAAMRPVVQSLHERMPGAIRYAAVVAYDATDDQAGNLSRSIALLNERGDGLVLTVLSGRTETFFFCKMVRAGRGTEALSPEEEQAVARARAG